MNPLIFKIVKHKVLHALHAGYSDNVRAYVRPNNLSCMTNTELLNTYKFCTKLLKDMKDDSYYCDKYHREKNEPPTDRELENDLLQRQCFGANDPEKYGAQLQFNFINYDR